MLKDIHDPIDPNTCCLRRPRFIQDKELKESIISITLNIQKTKDQRNCPQKKRKDKRPSFPDHVDCRQPN